MSTFPNMPPAVNTALCDFMDKNPCDRKRLTTLLAFVDEQGKRDLLKEQDRDRDWECAHDSPP